MKEWLDITVTKTMSFDDVTNELSSGGRFAGFRYATASDLISLWESVGIQLGTIPNPPPSNREKVLALLSFTGVLWSYSQNTQIGAYGLIARVKSRV